MLSKYTVKNKRGFSLVEVLVALGVVSIIGAGTMTLIANNMKSVQNLSGRMAEAMLISDLNQIIADKDLCKAAFTSASPQPLNLTTYKPKIQASGYGIVQEGAEIQKSIKIDRLEIRDFAVPQPTGVPNQMKVLGTLYIKTSDLQSGGVNRKEKIISTFGIYYDNGSKAIQACFGASAVPEAELCQKLGMTWDSAGARCKQAPSQSCADLGGTWSNGVCLAGGVTAPSSILGKSCGSGYVMMGFTSSGDPRCISTASFAGTPSPAPPSPAPPSPPPSVPTPPPPTLASRAYITGFSCSSSGTPGSDIMSVYINDIGRCADSGGLTYWNQQYFNFLNAGDSSATAIAKVKAAMISAAAGVTQSQLDDACGDKANYKFVPQRGQPINYCRVRCSVSPTDASCAP